MSLNISLVDGSFSESSLCINRTSGGSVCDDFLELSQSDCIDNLGLWGDLGLEL